MEVKNKMIRNMNFFEVLNESIENIVSFKRSITILLTLVLLFFMVIFDVYAESVLEFQGDWICEYNYEVQDVVHNPVDGSAYVAIAPSYCINPLDDPTKWNQLVTPGPEGPAGDLGAQGPAGPICGSSGQVIFNNNGVCAGANLQFDFLNDRLGIGITEPVGVLDVYTNPYNPFFTTGNVGIYLHNDDTGVGPTDGLEITNDSLNAYIWNYEDQGLILGTKDSERIKMSTGYQELVCGSVLGVYQCEPYYYPNQNVVTIKGTLIIE